MKTPLHYRTRMPHMAWVMPLFLLIGCSPRGAETDEHGAEAAHSDEDEHDEDEHGHETEGGHDDHEGESGHIELTETQFRSAGIKVTAAQPARVSEVLHLPGTVAPNADAVLHVTPRVSGQVRSVTKHLGEPVTKGELLLTLDSVELGVAIADYLRDKERVAAAEETLSRESALFKARFKSLKAILEGAIAIQERIFEREQDLQRKAVSTMRPLLEADKAFQLAKLDKDKQLTELGAERDLRMLELEVDLRTKRIDLTAAGNQLKTLGLSEDTLTTLNEDSPLLGGEYPVLSPGDGIIVNRHASRGEFVDAGAKLYIIENLSNVWFVASAFEEQLQSVRTGQAAKISLDAFPAASLTGIVSFLDYHVDTISRSVGVRITLDNAQLASWSEEYPLRPGMFGRVELETVTREARLVLPESALIHDDAGNYVFVQVEPFAFERREIEAVEMAGGVIEIMSGLNAGDMVATSGTFLLKSAERQGELGGGHSH